MKRNTRYLPVLVIGVAALAASTAQLLGYQANQPITETNGRHTLSAGGAHTLAVIPLDPSNPEGGGKLYSWGDNAFGQLGLGDFVDLDPDVLTDSPRATPRQVGHGEDWVLVAAGTSHSLAIKTDGTLWAWGDNDFGQLGIGTLSNSATPVQVGTSNNWNAIAAGDDFSLALDDTGVVYAWGTNANGRAGFRLFGSPVADTYTRPTQLTYSPLLAPAGKNAADFGWNSFDRALGIAAGVKHGMLIKDVGNGDGTGAAYAWGENFLGELADAPSGYIFPSFRRIDGDTNWYVVEVGGGLDGGSMFGIKDNTPTVAGDGGLLLAWGLDVLGRLGLGGGSASAPSPVGGARYTKVSANQDHTLALQVLTPDDPATAGVNELTTLAYGWGYNITDLSPLESPAATLGFIAREEIGLTTLSQNLSFSTPISIPITNPAGYGTSVFATNVEAGSGYSHIILSDDTLRSTGENNEGQLGNQTFIDVENINSQAAGRAGGSIGFGNPDLTIGSVSTPAPELDLAPSGGNGVMDSFSVSARIDNVGTGALGSASGAPVTFYLSLDDVFQAGSDVPLWLVTGINPAASAADLSDSLALSVAIPVAESGSVGGQAVIASVDTVNGTISSFAPASGQYKVLARVDPLREGLIGGVPADVSDVTEVNETNNDGVGTTVYDILADLTVSVTAVSQAGDDIDFDITVSNRGQGAIVEGVHQFEIELYATYGATLGGGNDTLIATYEWPADELDSLPDKNDPNREKLFINPIGIGGGRSTLELDEGDFFQGGVFPADVSVPFQLTDLSTQQDFYLIAFADAEGEILEEKEFNNQGASATASLSLGKDPFVALDLTLGTLNLPTGTEAIYTTGSDTVDGYFTGVDDADFAQDPNSSGDDALRSPALEAGQETGIGFQVVGPARIDFDWQSQANNGELVFQIDGTNPDTEFPGANKLSGNTGGYVPASFIIPAGTHFIEWRYTQLSSDARTDFTLIDNVRLTPISKADLLLESVTYTLPENTSDPSRLNITVTGINRGADTSLVGENLSNFTLALALSEDTSLGAEDVFLTSIPLNNISGGARFAFNNIELDPDAEGVIDSLPVGTWNLIAYIDPPEDFSNPLVSVDGGITPVDPDDPETYLVGVVDEIDEENNEVVSSTLVQVEELIEVRPVSVAVDPLSPNLPDEEIDVDANVFAKGDVIAGNFSLVRSGLSSEVALQPFSVDVVISTDRDIGVGDFRLLTVDFPNGARTGELVEWSAELPDDAPFGNFVSIGIIVDPENVIQEFDESNNTEITDNRVFLTEVKLVTAVDLDGVAGNDFQPAQDFNSIVAQGAGAAAPFFGQTAFTNDGVDAAQSAPIDNNETAAFEVTFTPTQTTIISFNWAVTSEEPSEDTTVDNPGDVFRFLIDGVLAGSDAEIAGLIDWEARSYTIPAVANPESDSVTLRWEFVKDSAGSVAGEGAFVDNIVISSPNLQLDIGTTFGPGAANIASSTFAVPLDPFDSGAGPFQSTFTIVNAGNAPVSPNQNILVELRLSPDTNFDDSDAEEQNDFELNLINGSGLFTGVFNAGLLAGETSDNLSVQYLLPANIAIPENMYLVGKVDVVVPGSGINGAVTESSETDNEDNTNDPIFPVEPSKSIDDAIDFLTEFFPWDTAGNGTFFGQDTVNSILDGDAVTTSPLDASQGPVSSYLETRLEGPSVIEFFWKSSIPDSDSLSFAISGDTLTSISGDTHWQFTTGSYTVTFDRINFTSIPYNATAAEIEAAIEELLDPADASGLQQVAVSLDNVTVDQQNAREINFSLEFLADFTNQPQIIVDTAFLELSPTVDVNTTRSADGVLGEIQQVVIRTRQSFFLPAGSHTVRFTYNKTSSATPDAGLLDAVFIDAFSQSPVSEPDLVLVEAVVPAGDYIVNESNEIDAGSFVERGILPIQVRALNRGASANGFSDATADIELRLSTDLTWGNSDDVVIGNFADVEGLVFEGNSLVLDGNFEIPLATPEGQYYLAAYVSYFDSDIDEFQESVGARYTSGDNNLFFTGSRDVNILRLPDLVIESVAFDLSRIYYGRTPLRLNFDLANVGLGDYDGLTAASVEVILHAVNRAEYGSAILPEVDGPPASEFAFPLATFSFEEELPGVSPALADGSSRNFDMELILPSQQDLRVSLLENGAGSLDDYYFLLDFVLDESNVVAESGDASHFTVLPLPAGIVISEIPASDSFQAFAARYGLSGATVDAIALADSDGDGVINLFEYAFDRSPISTSGVADELGLIADDPQTGDPSILSYGMVRVGGNDYLRITFDMNNLANDLEYVVEQSGGSGNFTELLTLTPPYDGADDVIPARETLAELILNNELVTAASDRGYSARVTVRDNIPEREDDGISRQMRLTVRRVTNP